MIADANYAVPEAISCPSATVCYVAGAASTSTSPVSTVVTSTKDGDATWSTATLPAGTVTDVSDRGASLSAVRTVVADPLPVEVRQLLARRAERGVDLYDEVWEGVYHMNPAPHPRHGYTAAQVSAVLHPYAETAGLVETGPFNLGDSTDYRVPDGGYHRTLPDEVFAPDAAVVVEVLSAGDETFAKLGFYAAHSVEEVLIADPQARSVRIFRCEAGLYHETARSSLLGVDAERIARHVAWR